MHRFTRAVGALIVSALVAVGLVVGMSAPSQAAVPSASSSRAALAGVPGLTGTGMVGQPLTALLAGLPTVLPVQWLRDGASIPGATGSAYTPTLADVGHSVSALVTLPLVGPVATPAITIIGTVVDPGDPGDPGIPGVPGVPDVCLPDLPLPLPDLCLPGGTDPVTVATDVTVGGPKKIGTTLTTSGPTWDPADATSTYQWMRDGSPVGGATKATYPLTPEDFGRSITVVITGHQEGFTDNTVTSAPVAPLVGDAIQFVMKPRITGVGKVGRLLTADPGQWTGGTEGSGLPTFGYQWSRGGTPISGAVAQTYQAATADVGQALSVTVTATRPAYKAGKLTTASVSVARMASSVKAALSKKSVKKGQKATLSMVVKAAGGLAPAGKVAVFDGKKKLKTITLTRASRGHSKMRLHGLKKGTHKLKAVYAGSSTVSGASSKTVKLQVRK